MIPAFKAHSTAFYTLTINGDLSTEANPGCFDPAIPLALANAANVIVTNAPNAQSSLVNNLLTKAEVWTVRAERMRAGGKIPWWQPSTTAVTDDLMTYECDDGLGSPSEVDCTQIAWHQLDSTLSDTLTVGPEQVSFYHSSTCQIEKKSSIPDSRVVIDRLIHM